MKLRYTFLVNVDVPAEYYPPEVDTAEKAAAFEQRLIDRGEADLSDVLAFNDFTVTVKALPEDSNG